MASKFVVEGRSQAKGLYTSTPEEFERGRLAALESRRIHVYMHIHIQMHLHTFIHIHILTRGLFNKEIDIP